MSQCIMGCDSHIFVPLSENGNSWPNALTDEQQITETILRIAAGWKNAETLKKRIQVHKEELKYTELKEQQG